MKRRLTAILAGVFLTVLSSESADSAPSPDIRGVGLSPCAAWTVAQKVADDASNPGWARLIFVSWVLGYATAYERANAPISLDNDALNNAVDAYCGAHPTETVLDAVNAVIATSAAAPRR